MRKPIYQMSWEEFSAGTQYGLRPYLSAEEIEAVEYYLKDLLDRSLAYENCRFLPGRETGNASGNYSEDFVEADTTLTHLGCGDPGKILNFLISEFPDGLPRLIVGYRGNWSWENRKMTLPANYMPMFSLPQPVLHHERLKELEVLTRI